MENTLYKTSFISFLLLCFLYQYFTIIRSLINILGILTILAVLSWQLAPILIDIFIKPFIPKVDPRGKAVFVTGCDSGFGHEAALLLNSTGFKVFAGCLLPNGPGAESLKAKAEKPDQLIVIKMDITKDEDIDAVYEEIKSSLDRANDSQKLWGLVNNAGIARLGFIELGDFNYFFREVFDVNVFGTVKVTRKFAPLIRQSKGRIVVLSSVASRVSISPMACYSMTKHCITAFCDCLRDEIADAGVKVVSIEPYFYTTGILSASSLSEQANRCWNDTNDSIKKNINRATYDQMVNNFLSHLRLKSLGANQDLGEVSRTVVTALTDPEPMYRYVCTSYYKKPFILIGQLIPREIVIPVINIFRLIGI